MFVSLHRDPFYPGSGSRKEKGQGPGRGTTLNFPLGSHTRPRDYLSAAALALEKVLSHKPDLFLVSAGFDTYKADPLGGLNLDEEHFQDLGRLIEKARCQMASRRLIMLLEGGYHLGALPGLVLSFLRGLLMGPGQKFPGPHKL